MKKLLLAFAVTLGLAVAVPVSAAPSVSAQSKIDVSGNVIIEGKSSKGARVVVFCNNNVKRDVADASGNYFVQFNKAQCPTGATITVTARQGNKGGTSTAKAEADGQTTVNVKPVGAAVPEFGTVAGISAAVAVGGGFMLMRRRQFGGTQA